MSFNNYKIFDFHVHFPTLNKKSLTSNIDEEYIGKFGRDKFENSQSLANEAVMKRWKVWDMKPPSKEYKSDEEIMELWKKEKAEKGIEKIVFVTGGGNRHLSELIGNSEDIIGFAHNDPEEPDSPVKVKRAVEEYGLKGYKLLAPNVKRPLNDESLFPLWEEIEKLEIPVLIHFGILGGGAGVVGKKNCNPLMLEDIAKGFPNINFVIPHFGAGYMRELLLLGWACPNVYVDMSGSNQWIKWMPDELSKKTVLAKFIQCFGTEKIIYGTDSSYLPRGYIVDYLKEWMRIFDEISLSEAEISSIMYDNAYKLIYR